MGSGRSAIRDAHRALPIQSENREGALYKDLDRLILTASPNELRRKATINSYAIIRAI